MPTCEGGRTDLLIAPELLEHPCHRLRRVHGRLPRGADRAWGESCVDLWCSSTRRELQCGRCAWNTMFDGTFALVVQEELIELLHRNGPVDTAVRQAATRARLQGVAAAEAGASGRRALSALPAQTIGPGPGQASAPRDHCRRERLALNLLSRCRRHRSQPREAAAATAAGGTTSATAATGTGGRRAPPPPGIVTASAATPGR